MSRLKLLLKSKLSCRNLIMAINTWAIAMVRYGEGVIGWTKVELEEMGTNTWQLLIQHGGARREFEKINNYSELRVEIGRVGNTETEVVPEVIAALGSTPKNLYRHLESLGIRVHFSTLQY